jgi:hypothetical protein
MRALLTLTNKHSRRVVAVDGVNFAVSQGL